MDKELQSVQRLSLMLDLYFDLCAWDKHGTAWDEHRPATGISEPASLEI